ncbi:MAG: hypothetical protein QXD80_00535 [Acidilobaceae archaeon]
MSTKSSIAAGNIIVGVYNFIVLSHPETWRIIPLPGSSESLSFTSQGKVKWVTRGIAENGIRTPNGVIGLRIRVWPGLKKASDFKELNRAFHRRAVKLGGHEANAYIYIDSGWFKPTNRVLAILTYCNYTNRSLLIEFIGGGEWVDEIISYISESECHVEGEETA